MRKLDAKNQLRFRLKKSLTLVRENVVFYHETDMPKENQCISVTVDKNDDKYVDVIIFVDKVVKEMEKEKKRS